MILIRKQVSIIVATRADPINSPLSFREIILEMLLARIAWATSEVMSIAEQIDGS